MRLIPDLYEPTSLSETSLSTDMEEVKTTKGRRTATERYVDAGDPDNIFKCEV